MTRPKLKHEVHDILNTQGNDWMQLKDIADRVNERGLYQSTNGSPVNVDDIFELWEKHRNLFERNGTRLRCRE